MSWTEQARKIHKEAYVFYFVFKHPRVRWYARMIAACTAGYLLSPIQLIPSFIPVIGFLDDLVALFLGVALLNKVIPPDVLNECRQLAEARSSEQIRSPITLVVPITVAVLWLLAALAVSAAMASYVVR